MKLDAFLHKLTTSPESVSFAETMAAIEAAYDFTPTAFTNGTTTNPAGQNSGSCKLFAFALLNQLSPAQTLACFGTYYREDVLNHPEGTDHQNIRNFITSGWSGIQFDSMPLQAKAA